MKETPIMLKCSFKARLTFPHKEGVKNSVAYFPALSLPAAESIPRVAALCSDAVLGAEFSSLCFAVTAQRQAEKPIFLRCGADFISTNQGQHMPV